MLRWQLRRTHIPMPMAHKYRTVTGTRTLTTTCRSRGGWYFLTRRRRRLWRGTPEHPDPHGASRGGYLNIPRVRQLDAPQKRPPGLHAEQDQLSLWWCGRNLGMDMTRKHKD